eukprot:NODE_5909_length_545_cov_276.144898.p1 GENE.NODE_5909_length_545_cov_276.144898~~NODE_5909_length_545_cov_276.144898.p1  ORF type:complete len:142 (+),score=24.92 NODE_5909_length_545_cov_276.144898:3-428(+)
MGTLETVGSTSEHASHDELLSEISFPRDAQPPVPNICTAPALTSQVNSAVSAIDDDGSRLSPLTMTPGRSMAIPLSAAPAFVPTPARVPAVAHQPTVGSENPQRTVHPLIVMEAALSEREERMVTRTGTGAAPGRFDQLAL